MSTSDSATFDRRESLPQVEAIQSSACKVPDDDQGEDFHAQGSLRRALRLPDSPRRRSGLGFSNSQMKTQSGGRPTSIGQRLREKIDIIHRWRRRYNHIESSGRDGWRKNFRLRHPKSRVQERFGRWRCLGRSQPEQQCSTTELLPPIRFPSPPVGMWQVTNLQGKKIRRSDTLALRDFDHRAGATTIGQWSCEKVKPTLWERRRLRREDWWVNMNGSNEAESSE